MTNDISTIERVVMRRARAVHMLRPFVSGAALALVLVALSLYGIGKEVWVARVFENAPHTDFAAMGRFFIAAIINTRVAVQALLALGLFATIYLAREMISLASSVLALSRMA